MKELTKSELELFKNTNQTLHDTATCMQFEDYDIALSKLSDISYSIKLIRSQIKSHMNAKRTCEVFHE